MEAITASLTAADMMARSEATLSPKALFMTVWCPDSRSVESNCGILRTAA